MFENVPSISVPDSNNVYHPFLDTTIASNAAAASDIAQGKLAYVNGSLVIGTNQGGGGGTSIVWGKIRGDAALAKSWTYNKLIHADEGVTIPTYTTSNTTLKSGSSLTSESLNFADYSYMMLYRCLAMPIYSDSTKSAGRQIHYSYSGFMPIVFIPASAFSYDGTTATASSNTSQFTSMSFSSFYRIVYCQNASSIRFTNQNYGAYLSAPSASITVSSTSPYDTATLSVTSPDLRIRGSNTYLNSTNWNKITDIRYQYIFELYRVPRSATVHGWEHESQFRHILDCANGNGTLT